VAHLPFDKGRLTSVTKSLPCEREGDRISGGEIAMVPAERNKPQTVGHKAPPYKNIPPHRHPERNEVESKDLTVETSH